MTTVIAVIIAIGVTVVMFARIVKGATSVTDFTIVWIAYSVFIAKTAIGVRVAGDVRGVKAVTTEQDLSYKNRFYNKYVFATISAAINYPV